MIPKDFPDWGLVWQYFRKWRDDGTLETVRLALNRKVRAQAGKNPLPSAVIADSQSVKTTEKGGRVASMGENSSRGANALRRSIAKGCC